MSIEVYRHKQLGTTYQVLGQAQLQTAQPVVEGSIIVVYQGPDGKIWCRPQEEFYGDKFEPVNAVTEILNLRKEIEDLRRNGHK